MNETIQWLPDEMYGKAEHDARDYSAFPGNRPPSVSTPIEALLKRNFCKAKAKELQSLPVDDYVATVLEPAELPSRASARDVIRQLKGKVVVDRAGSDGQQRRLGAGASFAGCADRPWLR